jgi:cysteine desulfurase / selenocysteine lyase
MITEGTKLGDRSQFPDLDYDVYMNHAAISPPSLAVRAAVLGVLDDYARHGAASFPTWAAHRMRLREAIARLVGARAADVALVPNTSAGILDVALCFPWERGDRVLIFEGEFPANVTPWLHAAELFGLEVVWAKVADFLAGEDQGLEAFRIALARGVRLVAVSAVEFQTGLRMPVEAMAAMCHAAGAEICVDAVQACGAVPIDVGVAGIDYLAAGAHKWLMGLEGAGFLYVSPDRVASLRPRVAGWLSHEDPVAFLLRGPGQLRYDRPIRKRADLVEGGNVNTAGLAGLAASLHILLAIGVPEIFAHVGRILDALEAGLVARGFRSLRSADPRQRSAILSVEPPAGVSVVSLSRELLAHRVGCSIPDGNLRFSPHWPNDVGQVPEVLAAVDASVAKSVSA